MRPSLSHRLVCRSAKIATRRQRWDFLSGTATVSNQFHTEEDVGVVSMAYPVMRSPSMVCSRSCCQRNAIHNQRRGFAVFVSSYNESNVTASQIVEYCAHHGLEETEMRKTSTHVVLKECPFCSKPTGGKADNLYKLYILIGGGAYFCHRCGAGGSWYDFKLKMGGFEVVGGGSNSVKVVGNSRTATGSGSHGGSNRGNGPGDALRMGLKPAGEGLYLASKHGAYGGWSDQKAASAWKSSAAFPSSADCLPMPSARLGAVYITNLVDNSPNEVLTYLTDVRGIQRKTLLKYGVGRATYRFPTTDATSGNRYVDAECVTFPWIMKASEVEFQESLRGANFVWKDEKEDSNGSSKENEESDSPTEIPQETAEQSSPYAGENGESQQPRVPPAKGPFITRRIKARAVSNKAWQRLDPPGGGWGLFGWHTVPTDAKEIVITEGEYDAMAVYQATERPAVSLPNGCRSLPTEVLPMLERFEKVYLWMDNDRPGQEGAENFAKKIGLRRCLIVQPTNSTRMDGENGKILPPPKDANEALLMGHDLRAILQEAKVVQHDRILTFSELRPQVLHEVFFPEEYSGVPVPSLPTLNRIIKGFRRGEMTVVTGPTGSGKTTFLGQLSIDFTEQGVNTLWGSFEIKNSRLMHKLLQQFSREELPTGKRDSDHTALKALADRFEQLPLFFMRFHGGSDVDAVIDAMDYAVYVHDVEHIILDNMQFMISRHSGGGGTFDKFDMQDIAIEKFRKFATEKNVHVTVVVHPRKEDEGAKLGISSIYGSAKATQEADTVLILQYDGKNKKYIEVKKNRFDGTLGICRLNFHRQSSRYDDKFEQIPMASSGRQEEPRKAKSVAHPYWAAMEA